MSEKLRPEHTKSRSGSILVMTAALAVVIIGITALVTDVGYLYYNHSRLQTAVNAGWKAGFDRMSSIKSRKFNLNPTDQAEIRAHVLEVMKANGYTDAELANVEVSFGTNSGLFVNARQTIGLFFAKVLDLDSANVAASRGNMESGAGIIPLAIPHGVTKDFSKNMYSCSMFTGEEGFTIDKEYVLKLGSGGGNGDVPPGQDDLKMILVPMDAGSQTADGFLKAYGVAFWCLRIGNGSDQGFVPVQWLLGYRGGSFMLPYHEDVVKELNARRVNFIEVVGSDNIQAIFDLVNPNILELYDRPRIAVYSSQNTPDPVEDVLRAAYIPYGTYSMPEGWQRNENYSSAANNRIYDGEILENVLDNYHWVHLHHEDFTGFSGGCSHWADTCYDFYHDGRLGSTNNNTNRTKVKQRMCSYCSSKYNSGTNSFSGYTASSCLLSRMRCAERVGVNGVFWRNDPAINICSSDAERPQCREYNRLLALADEHGYSSDPGSEPKPRATISDGNNGPGIAADADGWFNRANKVQKMKWAVARKIRNHVEVGGFLFAQCFAPETLDISLWQAAINEGVAPSEAFSECFAFQGFAYRRFPIKENATYYSTLNVLINPGSNVPFDLLLPLDPRCQNHGNRPDTGTGHTSVFSHSCLHDEVTVLGNRITYNSQAKYLKGKRGTGEFTFLGGHYHHNTESKRLVLNNILLGSLVDKQVNGEVPPPEVAGKNKNNYGPIDPDNSLSGGANDYRDRFMFGCQMPIEINDRLVSESGNMRGPTDQAVEFRVLGDEIYPPSIRVIVPITDVGPEIATNNPHNVDAETIYDMQGQDHPNGVYKPEDYPFGSSVRVIGFAEFEIIPPESFTRVGTDYETGDAGSLGPYQPGQVRGKFIRYIVKPGEAAVY